MRIATWNVNSVRSRADRMIDFLKRHDIDVLAVQETKVRDDKFPYLVFEEAGYQVAHVGYSQWNGVAIISRVGLEDVADHFPGQPGFHKDPAKPQDAEARAVGATCGGVRVWSLYVPNGREIGDPHYDYKLAFFYALARHTEQELQQHEKLVLMGDFNVAPRDEDVWDISLFEGKTHITEPERAAMAMLEDAGLREVTRDLTHEHYTYWDYKSMRFQKGEGMRIDFQLASQKLAGQAKDAFVDTEERSGKGASDHAPVVVEYTDTGKDYDNVR
ncbi:exodeoxyribonuclease III [Corynebacterium doosanense]|uniref:Exodeoxyribonuclease III n=1 Tax=Corynebacterium doosanense CAU 212 = DSM 45436 TaxID=558173 RepID=A0A097IID5_9CORY|nr:exodeoxyribonuclease III [Corynebacterium doosanense]AIT61888.1 exodeoxyribonuclease III [Corynebacterium doosanense CAU 212 = DSM 45436]